MKFADIHELVNVNEFCPVQLKSGHQDKHHDSMSCTLFPTNSELIISYYTVSFMA
jgi:hypothetical protein